VGLASPAEGTIDESCCQVHARGKRPGYGVRRSGHAHPVRDIMTEMKTIALTAGREIAR
jgi:hypothetical protein